MPTGKVRFYDDEKGFGFISSEDGQDVFLHASALPADAEAIKAGTRVEFGMADGRKGPQALSVRVLDRPAARVKPPRASRKKPDELAVIIEDVVRMLDGVGEDLRRGHYPTNSHARKAAQVLRKVADEIDA